MSFLRRLSRLEPEPTIERIARNLARIFNSRKEYGSVVREFGLGDYEERWDTPGLLDTLMAEIVAAVSEFEPDLTDPLEDGHDQGVDQPERESQEDDHDPDEH